MKPASFNLKKISPILLAFALLTASCSKKDDTSTSSYPKNVTIEYKLTPSAGITTGDVIYFNETGSTASVTGAALPFTKQISRTVNKYEGLGLSVTASGNGNIKMDILVNGSVVKTATPSGTSIISGNLAYVFE